MNMTRIVSIITAFSFLILSSSLYAQESSTEYRGFTINVGTDASEIANLGNGQKFEANLVFYQIVDGPAMDNWTWEERVTETDRILDHLDDNLLPVLQANGVKVVLVMYGKFQSRTPPARHQIFADPDAQQELVDIWEIVADRYKDNDNIIAFDLLNEPAERAVATELGVKNWKQFIPDLVGAIRAIAPDKILIVEPRYGNATHLPKIAKTVNTINEEAEVSSEALPNSVQLAIHPYASFAQLRPGSGRYVGEETCGPRLERFQKRLNKAQRRGDTSKIAKFEKKVTRASKCKGQEFIRKQLLRKVQKISNRFPNLVFWASEFAVSRWLDGAALYLDELIELFEELGVNWAYHGYGEDSTEHQWSVEHSDDAEDLDPVAGITDRAQVLIDYFTLNVFE